jgi:hypothetical protein
MATARSAERRRAMRKYIANVVRERDLLRWELRDCQSQLMRVPTPESAQWWRELEVAEEAYDLGRAEGRRDAQPATP